MPFCPSSLVPLPLGSHRFFGWEPGGPGCLTSCMASFFSSTTTVVVSSPFVGLLSFPVFDLILSCPSSPSLLTSCSFFFFFLSYPLFSLFSPLLPNSSSGLRVSFFISLSLCLIYSPGSMNLRNLDNEEKEGGVRNLFLSSFPSGRFSFLSLLFSSLLSLSLLQKSGKKDRPVFKFVHGKV